MTGIILATAPVDEYCARTLGGFGELKVADKTDEDSIVAAIGGATALIVRGAVPVTDRILAAAPQLRVIGRTGVGYDTIDVAACTKRGIPLVFTPGVGARAVSEAALGFMLTMCKRMPQWDRELKSGSWDVRYSEQCDDLDERTLGIVGFGRIGQMTARMAAPFNMRILAHDPALPESTIRDMGVEPSGLEPLLERSDFIALHCPLLPETRGLINAQSLQQVKPGSYLVNLARGGVIADLDCLDDALCSGRLAGVALDVFDPSPPDVSHRLFANPRCLVSPHAMGTSRGALARIFRSMSDDMAAILNGGRPEFVVNREVLNE